MAETGKKIDWSDKCYQEMLVYQRKSAIHTVNRDRIAEWYGLRPGMTMVDVGCGLGFLGLSYWSYFGSGGHYVGIDESADLLSKARQASRKWADGGKATFVSGDAYSLPLDDNSADGAICQTLLMHLKHPDKALKEMIRIVKPGGVVICQEPDNLTVRLALPNWSLPPMNMDDLLLREEVVLRCYFGRLKLGLGDERIGAQVFHMMLQEGLVDVDVRISEYAPRLHPPYTDEREQTQLEMLRKQHLDDNRRKALQERDKETFLAGGGEVGDWERYIALGDRLLEQLRQQIEDGEYHYCNAYPFYYVRGCKPGAK